MKRRRPGQMRPQLKLALTPQKTKLPALAEKVTLLSKVRMLLMNWVLNEMQQQIRTASYRQLQTREPHFKTWDFLRRKQTNLTAPESNPQSMSMTVAIMMSRTNTLRGSLLVKKISRLST